MFQIEVTKSQNLLRIVFSQRVTPEETHQWRVKLAEATSQMQPGFILLTDLSSMDSMDTACAPDIEWGMELLDEAGIAKVVRVIPDPRKDIGLNIMSVFHYRRRIPIVVCDTMEEALKELAVQD